LPATFKEIIEAAHGTSLTSSKGGMDYYRKNLYQDYLKNFKEFDLAEQKKRLQYNIERKLPYWIDVRKDGRPQVIKRPWARCTNPYCNKLGNVYHFVGTHLMVCYYCGHNMLDFNSMVIPKRVGPHGFQYAIPKRYAQAKFMKDHNLHETFF
jgi:hypothetical protein